MKDSTNVLLRIQLNSRSRYLFINNWTVPIEIESITPATLNLWKQEYLDGTDVDKVDKKEPVELKKKLRDFQCYLES